jgi:tape measure domain-containing protein
MSDKKVIDDWIVDVGWSTKGFDKVAKKIEKTLNGAVTPSRQSMRKSQKFNDTRLQQELHLRKIQSKEREAHRLNDALTLKRQKEIAKEAEKTAAANQKALRARVRSSGGQSSRILGGEELDAKRASLQNRIRRSQEASLKVLGRQSKEYKAIRKQAQALNKDINSTVGVRNLQKLSASVDKFTGATDAATSASKRHKAALQQQNFTTKSLTDSTRNLARSYFSVFAAVEGGGAVVGVATRFDSLSSSMLMASGSAEEAAKDFEFLKGLSRELGIDIEVTTDGFRKFGAASRGAGLSGAQSKEMFADISAAVTGVALSADRANLVFLAMSQILSKGTVSMEEIKKQLGEQLPTALQDAAKAMGMLPAEFIKAVESGSVMSDDFLPKFAKQLKRSAVESGALAMGIKTIGAAAQRLSTDWKLLIKDISERGGKLGIIKMFSNLTRIMESLTPAFKVLLKIVGGTVLAISSMLVGFTAAVGPMFDIINNLINGLGKVLGLVAGEDGLTVAFEALGFILGAIAVIWSVSKIGAMAMGIGTVVFQVQKLLKVLMATRAVMAGIAFLTTLASGGTNIIAGAAVTGAAFGVGALVSSSDSKSATTTIIDQRSLTVTTPIEDFKNVAMDYFEGSMSLSNLAGG